METNKSKSGFVTVYALLPSTNAYTYLNMRVEGDFAWFEDINGVVRLVSPKEATIYTVTQMRRARKAAYATIGSTDEWNTPTSVTPFLQRDAMTLFEAISYFAKLNGMEDPGQTAANTLVDIVSGGYYRLTKGA